MDFPLELMNLIIRFGFNLTIAFIIIKLIYQRNHTNNDFVFTYFMFNSLIFFFAFLLGNITINIGFAFGLFAVFAILRYRTDPIPIKEMTYLFIVITIGVINALSGAEVSHAQLLFTNMALVGLTYFLETYWRKNLLVRITIEYEKIENIKPEKRDTLLADLKERTGLNIQSFEFRRMNFLRDTARIRIYYKE
jgi:vacuolar-type H+-ATPase subunit I/STV1|tara:strand:- start:901 stop:1479 length:579 start_codon:yes stop_codon:yes gene_type:complete